MECIYIYILVIPLITLSQTTFKVLKILMNRHWAQPYTFRISVFFLSPRQKKEKEKEAPRKIIT